MSISETRIRGRQSPALRPGLLIVLLAACSVGLPLAFGARDGGRARPLDPRIERFEKEIDQLRRLLKIPGLSGVILENKSVIWSRGLGFADPGKRLRATGETPYPIASLTKTFAATLIMRLVEQGKLRLDEPMSRYSDHFKDDSVRIKHILSHTSEGTPGDRYSYNGDLYGYLTPVIERLCGKPFAEIIVTEFLEPLGMTHSVPGAGVAAEPEKWRGILGPDVFRRYEKSLRRLARPHRLYGAAEIIPTPQRA